MTARQIMNHVSPYPSRHKVPAGAAAERLFSVASRPLAYLPGPAALKLGGRTARFGARLWADRRRFAVANIRRCAADGQIRFSGSAEDLAMRSFDQLGRNFVEIIRLYHGRDPGLLDRVEIRGAENYFQAKEKNRGVMVVTGHCGNWELMALAFAHHLDRSQVVARALNNPHLNRLLEQIRGLTGNGVIYKDGAIRSMMAAFKQKGTVGILMDQAVLREEAVAVYFLGRPALTSKLPALLARKMRVPVVPMFAHRENGRHVVTLFPEIPLSGQADKTAALREDTQRMTRPIEDHIRRYPDQWLWGHRRWKRAPAELPEE
jgi:KDO2-lipid IV(A) lauroyltransferase